MGSHRMNTDSEVLAEMLRIRGGRDGASRKTKSSFRCMIVDLKKFIFQVTALVTLKSEKFKLS